MDGLELLKALMEQFSTSRISWYLDWFLAIIIIGFLLQFAKRNFFKVVERIDGGLAPRVRNLEALVRNLEALVQTLEARQANGAQQPATV